AKPGGIRRHGDCVGRRTMLPVTPACVLSRGRRSISMTVRLSGARALYAAALLGVATSASAFPSSRVYTMRAYLDCAPRGATVVDRIDITGGGASRRQLYVTVFRNAGDGPVEDLSQEPLSPYIVWGDGGDVTRLFAAPRGTEFAGTVVLYKQATPAFLIA